MKNPFKQLTDYFIKCGINTIVAPYVTGLIAAVCAIVLCILFAASFSFCSKPTAPQIAPVNEKTIHDLQSTNEAEKNAAYEKVIEKIDSSSKLNDDERFEMKRKVEQSVKFGKNVTTADFKKLLEENDNQ
jgi:hypothetical protein